MYPGMLYWWKVRHYGGEAGVHAGRCGYDAGYARRFAAKVLDQVARNRAIIIVPGWWKILWWLERLAPTLNLVLVERLSASARREFYAPVDR